MSLWATSLWAGFAQQWDIGFIAEPFCIFGDAGFADEATAAGRALKYKVALTNVLLSQESPFPSRDSQGERLSW